MCIERGKRFVQQQDFGLCHKRSSQSHTLLLTAGQLIDVAVCKLGDLHLLEPLFRALSTFVFANTPHLKRKLHIFLNCQKRKQR